MSGNPIYSDRAGDETWDWVQRAIDMVVEAGITVRPKETFEMTPTECWYESPYYEEHGSEAHKAGNIIPYRWKKTP